MCKIVCDQFEYSPGLNRTKIQVLPDRSKQTCSNTFVVFRPRGITPESPLLFAALVPVFGNSLC